MGHYLDGEDGKVYVKMYAGRAMGLSFPTDGNRHYETWTQREFPVKIGDLETKVIIHTYSDGALISIEVDGLPADIISLETSV